MAWPATELLMRIHADEPQNEPRVYRDQIFFYPYDSIVLEEEKLHSMDIQPRSLSHPPPRLDIAHTYHHFPLSHPLSVSHQDELIPRHQLTHPSCSLLPTGGEPLGDRSPTYEGLGVPNPSELFTMWGSSHHPPGLFPDATCDVSPPIFRQSIPDPNLYSNSSCSQSPLSIGNARTRRVDEVLPPPSIYDHPAFPLPTASFPHPNLDNVSEPYNGTSDASYPCLWTEGGVVCSAMVQATRSYVNRHLHAYHGFGGSDAQQTRCCWAGCGAAMQQGSIARHMVTCHLQAKVTCPMCSKKLSRQDVISKHQRVCPAAGTWR